MRAGGISRLLLASSSARRLALLRQAGIEPADVVSPEIDESPRRAELPRVHALRLAEAKRDAVLGLPASAAAFVLAADTVVACGRRILPKALSEDEARVALRLLSGRRHRVYGGVALTGPDGRRVSRIAVTMVQFKRLEHAEVDAYLASGEWQGKAGGYAIQGLAETFVKSLNGSYSNVVGLPLQLTVGLLRGLGWRAPG